MTSTEVLMADDESTSLFHVVLYCIALVAAGLWAFRHFDFPW
jgi:hypothetical protein